MQNKENNKICIKLIKLLSKESLEDFKIQERLNITNSVLKKNLYYIKKSGFTLKRKNKKYKIENYKNFFILQPHEKSIVAHLISLGEIIFNEEKSKILNQAFENILFFSNKATHKEIFELKEKFFNISYRQKYKEKIIAIEKEIKKQKPIKITTIGNKELILTPLKINYFKNQAYLYYNDKKENKTHKISIKKIVQITPHKEILTLQNDETIFELYANLKNTYLLKENERIIDIQPNKLVIANSQDDKKTLLQRLLRYDELCRVVAPKKDVELMKEIINQSFKNLGEELE